MYKLTFDYNKNGYGPLCIWHNDKLVSCFTCRTGSINDTGKLVNAIKPGIWTAHEDAIETDEAAMVVNGFGFKLRLWTPNGDWSHYLIHPDGNKPGSAGCIVSLSQHKELYLQLNVVMAIMRILPVEITNF